MEVPAAGFIEAAQDMLKTVPDDVREDQQRELTAFGDGRARQLGASGVSTDFRKGYELGLQVVRVLIATSRDPRAI
jgi:hypothetical protein